MLTPVRPREFDTRYVAMKLSRLSLPHEVRVKSQGRTGGTLSNTLESRFQYRQTVNPTTFRHTRLREGISKKYTKGLDNITESNRLRWGEQYERKRLTKNTIPNPDLVGARSCIVAHPNIERKKKE